MAKNQNCTDVLIEEIDDNIRTILEIVVPVRIELSEVKKTVAAIPEIQADIKTIKLALAQTNIQVKDHEKRITKLETTIA